MRWEQARRSTNVDDRRGRGGAPRGAKLGVVGVLLVAGVTYAMGGDLGDVLRVVQQSSAGGSVGSTRAPGQRVDPREDRLADFSAAILGDTEDTWSEIFASRGKRYSPPQMVLFTQAVQSQCGFNSAAVGPFYCPPGQKVYLDLSFFGELSSRLGAPGDFAQAYVIAHEVGHHIQTITGISQKVRQMRSSVSRTEGNALSVRQELQADCFAGVWGHHAHAKRQLLEEGDIEEALKAAAAIGDDTLQRRSGGAVRPESWTHGSAEQRARWFKTGLKSGRMQDCDTFTNGDIY